MALQTRHEGNIYATSMVRLCDLPAPWFPSYKLEIAPCIGYILEIAPCIGYILEIQNIFVLLNKSFMLKFTVYKYYQKIEEKWVCNNLCDRNNLKNWRGSTQTEIYFQ